MGFLFLFVCLVTGTALMRRLPLRWYVPELIAAGCAVGLVGGSFLAAVFSLALPHAWSIPILTGLLAGVGIKAGLGYKRAEPLYRLGRIGPVWAAYAVLCAGFFGYLFWTHMLLPGDGGWFTTGPTWGDIALHMALASHFGIHDKLDLAFPLFPESALSYPFVMDYLSSLLLRYGWNMRWSLLVPGLMLMLSFCQLFFFLAYRLFASRVAAWLAPALFFLGGSAAGLASFVDAWRESGVSLAAFLAGVTKDYTYDPANGLHVYNVIPSALLPQRSTLMGFSIFCLVAILLHAAWNKNKGRSLLVGAAAALTGLMPFVHLHTFLVLFLALCLYALYEVRNGREVRQAAWPPVLVLGIAAPQLAWQLSASFNGGFSYFHWWWMARTGENPVWFWLRNIGLFFPVILAAPFLKVVWKERFHHLLAVLSSTLFGIINVAILQPNPYDNSKLLVYSLLVASLFVAAGVTALVRHFRWLVLPVGVALSLMLGTGMLALIPEFSTRHRFLSSADVSFAKAFDAAIPREAVVLTASNHNHPIPTLTGRKIVMGYPGWLWTYGIDYRPVERDVLSVYSGFDEGGGRNPDALMGKYGVTHVVIGPMERVNMGANESYFASKYPLVLDRDGYKVFMVR